MKKYMIFLKEDLQLVKNMSQEQLQEDIKQFTQWVEKLAKTGNYVSGDPLETSGWLIKKDEILTDGPFIESKEAIGGYFIIQAENAQKAIEIAQSCPIFTQGGYLELRPIMMY